MTKNENMNLRLSTAEKRELQRLATADGRSCAAYIIHHLKLSTINPEVKQ